MGSRVSVQAVLESALEHVDDGLLYESGQRTDPPSLQEGCSKTVWQ